MLWSYKDDFLSCDVKNILSLFVFMKYHHPQIICWPIFVHKLHKTKYAVIDNDDDSTDHEYKY